MCPPALEKSYNFDVFWGCHPFLSLPSPMQLLEIYSTHCLNFPVSSLVTWSLLLSFSWNCVQGCLDILVSKFCLYLVDQASLWDTWKFTAPHCIPASSRCPNSVSSTCSRGCLLLKAPSWILSFSILSILSRKIYPPLSLSHDQPFSPVPKPQILLTSDIMFPKRYPQTQCISKLANLIFPGSALPLLHFWVISIFSIYSRQKTRGI